MCRNGTLCWSQRGIRRKPVCAGPCPTSAFLSFQGQHLKHCLIEMKQLAKEEGLAARDVAGVFHAIQALHLSNGFPVFSLPGTLAVRYHGLR